MSFTTCLTKNKLTKKSYFIVLAQCSPAVRDWLEANSEWEALEQSMDVIELLKMIQSSLFLGATSWHTMHGILEAQDTFFNFRQTSRIENSLYLEKFKSLLAAYEHLGGEVGVLLRPPSEYIYAATVEKPTDEEMQAARKEAKEKYLAM